MRHAPVIALAATALGVCGSALPGPQVLEGTLASGAITGSLIDSVSPSRNWHGVEVSLMPGARRAVADSAGRFRFESLDDGEYTIAAAPLFLDSIGASPLQQRVRVAAGRTQTVTLATPSIATLQQSLCGRAIGPDESVVFGELRTAIGEPVGLEAVAAQWTVTVLVPGAIEQSAQAVVDTSTVGGRYALCGVPREDGFTLWAGTPARGTGKLVHGQGDQAIVRRDLVVGDSSAELRVVGRVLNEKGDPIIGARVNALDDSTRSAVVDSSGRFALIVSQRSQQLRVQAIGFEPGLLRVDPHGEPPLVADLTLSKIDSDGAQALAAVRVNANRTTARRAEFDERRRFENGYFLDDETLARNPQRTLNFLQFPRVSSDTEKVYLGSGAGRCAVRWFVDGMDVGQPDRGEPIIYIRLAKRIEIYRAAFAPPRFTDRNGCGVILIWTY
ncbi:MAG: carboxypeptidase regulatory-like domain-containing protein [Gemmatimonadaceae bacterium]|nr:carboxypeptidase regulatory-like domain-containing protein [Gemmatimonadaceae bacterium]